MKRVIAISMLAGLALNYYSVAAQAQTELSQDRVLQMLRQAIIEQEKLRADGITVTNPPAVPVPTFEDLEKQYLDGKISARQFKQYVEDFKLQRARAASGTNDPAIATAPVGISGKNLTNNPNAAALRTLSEVEARWDAIIRERAEREKARTNAPPAAAGTQSKTQRLDALRKEWITGKIADAEYRTKRDAILEEKD
jgi:hypothetical protein